MKLIFTLSFFLVAVSAFAQSVSMTIFNNGGQQFFVVMNGIRQNSLPETNVKIGGMTTGSYEIKLIFADGKTGDLTKKVYLESQGDYLMRVKEKGKKRKLQWFGIPEEGNQVAVGTAINYRPDDKSVYSDQPSNPNPPVFNQNQNSVPPTGSVQTQTTNGQVTTQGQVIPPTGTATSSGQAGTLNSEMNNPAGTTITIQNGMGGNNTIPPSIETMPTTYGAPVTIPDPNIPSGFGIHINADGSTPSGINSSSTTTTTNTTNGQTTTQTTTILQNGQAVTTTDASPNTEKKLNGVYTQPATIKNEAGTSICTEMLVDTEGFLTEIRGASFETDKREMIEYGLANACLTSDQAYRIVNSLTFEADRASVSKFLFIHLSDKSKGYKLIELMTFDSTKKELKAFMDSH